MLTHFSNEHIRMTYKWMEDTDLRRLFLMRGIPDWNGHQNYFRKVLADPFQNIYAILFDGCHVGNCGLKNLIPLKEGEFWIYIGDRSIRGKGIGKYAAGLLLSEGFKSMGLKMIYVHLADFNTVAKKMYEHLGFLEVPKRNSTKDAWENRGCNIIRLELKKN